MRDPALPNLNLWTLFRHDDGRLRLRLDLDGYLRGGSQVEFLLSEELLEALKHVEPSETR